MTKDSWFRDDLGALGAMVFEMHPDVGQSAGTLSMLGGTNDVPSSTDPRKL